MKDCLALILIDTNSIIVVKDEKDENDWKSRFWSDLIGNQQNNKFSLLHEKFDFAEVKRIKVKEETPGSVSVQLTIKYKTEENPETIYFTYSGNYIIEWSKPLPMPSFVGQVVR